MVGGAYYKIRFVSFAGANITLNNKISVLVNKYS